MKKCNGMSGSIVVVVVISEVFIIWIACRCEVCYENLFKSSRVSRIIFNLDRSGIYKANHAKCTSS